jgi:hypothetical protein
VSSEFDESELFDELCDEVEEVFDDVDEDFDDLVEVAVALPAMPEMRPMVSAAAAPAATAPATAARRGRDRPFMASTICGAGSGRPHRNVKPSSSLGRSALRARATPG